MFDKMKENLRETLTGSTPANDLRARLHADHVEVARLIDELLATDDVDVSMREDLKLQIIVQLTAHAKAEEEVVYTAFEQIHALRTQTDASFREHQDIDDLVRDLESLDGADRALAVVLRSLKTTIEHHVHEEENSVLPRAEKELGQQVLAEMVPRFNQRKAELMDSLVDELAATEPGYRRSPNTLSESDSRF